MNILHINTNDLRGGAARIPSRLVKEQRLQGYNSKMLVGFKETDLANTYSFDVMKKDTQLFEEKGMQYYDLRGSFYLQENPLFKTADVIHFHNLHGGYFNPYALSMLSHLKPTVWSLHDMHSITGHCAYSYDCTRWEFGCGNCPYIREYPSIIVDRTKKNWAEKKHIYTSSKLFVVPTAKWIENIAKQGILKNKPMTTILNGVDTQVYRPLDKVALRQKYGIPNNKIIIGAVANGGTFGQERKGGKYVQRVVDQLIQFGYNILLVNVGGEQKGYTSDYIYNVGYISSEEEMAEVYNTFDIYLFPSLADTCPLVISEAMACGVPVVTFATGGIPELVKHKTTGYVAPFKDEQMLYEYTVKLVEDRSLRKEFSLAARQYCLEHFDHNDVVNKYINVYENAIERFEKDRGQILKFDKSKVVNIVWNLPEFQKAEQLKETTLSEETIPQQKLIIISDRKSYFSNEYNVKTFEEMITYQIQENEIFYVDYMEYEIPNNFFEIMLYKGVTTDILASTVFLSKVNGENFFSLASSITNGSIIRVDTTVGGIFYNTNVFRKWRQSILRGQNIECSTKEEFYTELVKVNIQSFLAKRITTPVYVYGAGGHTMELIKECPFLKEMVVGVIDKNKKIHGTKLLDEFSIISLEETDRNIPILISSASYEKEIYEELKGLMPNQLIKIYNLE